MDYQILNNKIKLNKNKNIGKVIIQLKEKEEKSIFLRLYLKEYQDTKKL